MLMPPMSDPSEPSERMERSDNPSKTVTYALIFGGLTAAAAAAYFLTRTKRTPLPSAELIASGAVPGVTVNAKQVPTTVNAKQVPTNLQIGLKVAANPFTQPGVSVRVNTAPTQSEYGQKVTDIYNWSRPILAFAMYEQMQQPSMAGYRRLNGPFDIVEAGLGTVSDVASSVSDQAAAAQRQVAEAEARARAAAAAAAAAAAGRTASPSTAPDSGWGEVREWLRTGRLPMTRNKPAWNLALLEVGAAGEKYFTPPRDTVFFKVDPNFFGGEAGTMFTGPQLLALHGYTRQMYDLWVRGGQNAQAIPQNKFWGTIYPTGIRNYPFMYLRNQLNKG
jgi:hypothetical protein